MTSALAVDGLRVLYNRSIIGLSDVSLSVEQGQLVALLGSNGAGKTTLLRALSLTLGYCRGHIAAGSMEVFGRTLSGRNPHAAVLAGIAHVPEGRRVFTRLTVEENLRAGGFAAKTARDRQRAKDRVFALFPQLAEKRNIRAGLMSGGEQQMIAIGRALMSNPDLLMLDEPSLGLSPQTIERVADAIRTVNSEGTTVLLVEQNAGMALRIAEYAYVLDMGRIVLSGESSELATSPEVIERYLGGVDAVAKQPTSEVRPVLTRWSST
ncbi:ABC transporter ATP-binding protein [Microbacterium soli]|uniref:ABC transporter ATP-binding protein n=1 Tax=Microbacterium soli TaxID=446075 RepID=A0ABP7MX47_9MICO